MQLVWLARSNNPTMSTTSDSSSNTSGAAAAANYIEHIVSKTDTPAGVAIKYGVEVADIKKMNGLVTDLQMFALKSLRIPLPGRHPPSPSLVNGLSAPGTSVAQNPLYLAGVDISQSLQSVRLKSPQRKVSLAMSSLQGYYGLKNSNGRSTVEGTEMAVYKASGAHYLEDGLPPKPSPVSDRPPSQHQKSRSLVNGFLEENGELTTNDALLGEEMESEVEGSNEKPARWFQKSDAHFGFQAPERLFEENSGSSSFLAKTGKGLALRPKSTNRTTLPADTDSGYIKPVAMGLGDSVTGDGLFRGVRKSSSTSNLQDQDNHESIFSWSTSKRSVKPDSQSRSVAAIAKPIFDGLPKPMTSRRNKAALD